MTARNPAPNTASNGTITRRDITTMEIKAATAQARRAGDHAIAVESPGTFTDPGTVSGSKEKTGRSLDETFPATAGNIGSGTATRICGAPHCKQKGLPSSVLCPHLWQGWAIGASSRGRLKASHDDRQAQGTAGFISVLIEIAFKISPSVPRVCTYTRAKVEPLPPSFGSMETTCWLSSVPTFSSVTGPVL